MVVCQWCYFIFQKYIFCCSFRGNIRSESMQGYIQMHTYKIHRKQLTFNFFQCPVIWNALIITWHTILDEEHVVWDSAFTHNIIRVEDFWDLHQFSKQSTLSRASSFSEYHYYNLFTQYRKYCACYASLCIICLRTDLKRVHQVDPDLCDLLFFFLFFFTEQEILFKKKV